MANIRLAPCDSTSPAIGPCASTSTTCAPTPKSLPMAIQRSSSAFRNGLGLLLALALASLACGGEDARAPGELMVVSTDSGRFALAVSTEPNPPERGTNLIRYTVTDVSGAPIDG